MSRRDGLNVLQLVSLPAQTLSGVIKNESDWVDTRGFEMVAIAVASLAITDAGTAAGFTITLEENDDTTDAGATAVAASEVLGGVAGAIVVTSDTDDDKILGALGYIGGKRYVRITATGTTLTDAVIKADAICQLADVEPPTLIGTSVAAT